MIKYTVNDYIKMLKENGEIKDIINCENILSQKVENMTYNSKEVISNTLFICKGATFKLEYLKEAIKAGTFIYISEKKFDVNVPCVLVNDIKKSLSLLGYMYYNYSGDKINIIGITGTKGKTTTAYYIKYLLDEYKESLNQNKSAIISSIDTFDGVEHFESHLTTPESFDLQRHFYNAYTSDTKDLIMEVSSQALKYGRVNNVRFNIGIFLNISEDHISPIEHPDFNDYFESKLKIFSKTDTAIINLNSDFNDKILEVAKKNSKNVITVSTKEKSADYFAYNIQKKELKTVFNVRCKDFDLEFELNVPGIFNVENALVAIAVANYLKVPQEYIIAGIKKAKSSGRMEVYCSKDNKIITLVDYAHNKISFEKVFESVKEEYKGRYIVVVFGAPGGKAQIRRKDLGTIAGINADKIYITADDPGVEEVEKISSEIEEYVKKYNNNYVKINDRVLAIKEAIKYASNLKGQTVVLLLGKGNDATQKIGKEFVPYETDSKYAIEFLKEYDRKEF